MGTLRLHHRPACRADLEGILRERTGSARDRLSGVALMVVMILFVVLYMVVFHLHFYTKMEERVAQVRHGDLQSQDALYSVAQLIVAQLIEDLSQDYSEAADAQGGGEAGTGEDPTSAGGARGGARDDAGDDAESFVPIAGAAGAPPGAAAGGVPQHHDFLLEAVFNAQTQSLGDVEVKVEIVDNERRFDLNQIFGYVHIQGEDDALTGTGGSLTEDDLAGMAEGAGTGEAGTQTLARRMREEIGLLGKAGERSRPGRRGEDPVDDPDTPEDESVTEADVAMGLDEERQLTEFVEPSAERLEATTEMVARAIEVVLSLNEDRGFFYEGTYDSSQIATHIIDYVILRRSAEIQNRIYDSSELLNIQDYVTPELYFGPALKEIPEGGLILDDGFVISRDEFGDLVANYGYDDLYLDEQSARQEELDQLKEDFGSFMNFPGLGGLEANSLTRGMTGPAQLYDEETDSEFVAEPTLPIGIREIFTTFSTGKINLNTAPVPVLYALLPSLSEGPEGDANYVAVAINQHRYMMQPYDESGEGIDTNVAETPNLGQPLRQLPTDEEAMGGLGEESFYDQPGYSTGFAGASGFGAYDGGVGMEDLETNYFTNLQQIELVDGTDGGPDDILTSKTGVDRVSEEDDSVLQRVLNDYGQVMVFGSTYFSIKLKAKAENSPLIKTGYLIVKRDPAKRMMEMVFWKELQN